MLVPLLLICLLIAALTVLAVLFEDRSRPVSFFSPLVFTVLAFCFTYLVRGVLTFQNPDEFGVFTDHYPKENYTLFLAALGLSVVGIVSLIFGYGLGRSFAHIRLLPDLNFRSDSDAFKLSLIFILLGLAGFSVVLPSVLSSGAALQLFSTDARMAVLAAWSGRGQYMFLLLQAPLFFAAMLMASAAMRRSKLRKLIMLVLAGVIIIALGIIGSRQYLLAMLMVSALVYHFCIKPISLPVQAFFMTVMMLLGGLLGLILIAFAFPDAKPDPAEIAWLSFVRFTQSFDQFEMLSACLHKCQNFYFGLTPLEDVALTYLPRAVFPFKPEVFGAVRAQNEVFPHLYEYAGVTATYPIGFFGESYINFGPIGVVLLPLAFGFMMRVIVERGKYQKGYMIVLALLMANFLGTMRSAGGALLLMVLTITLVKLIYCLKFSSVRMPEIAPQTRMVAQ